MFLFKTALLEIRGRIVKTILLSFIFLLLFTGVLTSLTVLYSAEEYKSRVLENIGGSVKLDYASNELSGTSVFTSDILEKLSAVENVVGVNQHYADFAVPINFENNKSYSGKNPYLQEVQIESDPGFEDNIVIEGNIRTDLIDLFRNGAAHVISGNYPTEEQPGILISNVLAEQNNLEIGDVILVSAYDKELSLEIVGIYETSATFYVTEDNIIGSAVFAYSQFNRTYVDIDSAAELFDLDRTTLAVTAYINSPDNVQATGESIKAMDFDWDTFSLVNTTATEYSLTASSIESVSSLTKTFVIFFILIASVVIVIVMSIWAEPYQYESGIWLSLGASKWRAVGLLLFSTLCTALPALIIAICGSEWLASLVLNYQSGTATSNSTTVKQFVTGIETDAGILVTGLNMTMYGYFVIVVVWTILLACALPAYAVFRLKPREILSRE